MQKEHIYIYPILDQGYLLIKYPTYPAVSAGARYKQDLPTVQQRNPASPALEEL